MATTGLTTNFNLSYPIGADSVSLAADLQEMAEDIDAALAIMLPTTGGTMTGTLSGSNTTDASSPTTGAFKTAGGMGVAKKLYVGTDLSVAGTFTLGANTITLAGNLATSGAYNLTATLTGATNVTFPTTGTLATLAGSETLSNKTLTTPNIGAATGTSVALSGAISTDSTTNATSTTTGSIQTDGGIGVVKDVYVGGSVVATNVTGHNLLHNGAMQVHQRGTSYAGDTFGGYRTVDRWQGIASGIGTYTYSVESDAPTGSGFRKSLKVLCTTADASPAAGDYLDFRQAIEGQNLQSVLKGTTSAKPLTLSFWTKSNKTGTYVVELYDNDNTRHCSQSYTISSSATWEQKSITFPADLTGAFDNDNAASLYLIFWLAAGSNFTSGTLATTWATVTAANRAVGQTNLAAANNNYWMVTGVQLEVGSASTGYEFKNYDQELRECQRYYYRHATGISQTIGVGVALATNEFDTVIHYPVTMRIKPTIDCPNSAGYFTTGAGSWATFSLDSKATATAGHIYSSAPSYSPTQYSANVLYTNNASAYLGFSADL